MSIDGLKGFYEQGFFLGGYVQSLLVRAKAEEPFNILNLEYLTSNGIVLCFLCSRVDGERRANYLPLSKRTDCFDPTGGMLEVVDSVW